MRRPLLWLAVSLACACGNTQSGAAAIGAFCQPTGTEAGDAAQCSEKLCLALDSATGFCTRTCTDNGGCPADFECSAAGKYGRVCKKLTGCKADTECPSGHTCNVDTGNCYIKVTRTLCSPCQDSLQCPAGGVCFTAQGTLERFCTVACGDGDACPTGFACGDVSPGKGLPSVRQCVPVAETCNAGKSLCASCRGDDECGGAFDLCVRNVVSGEQFCGRDCNPKKNVCPTPGCKPEALESAPNPDCPEAFSCTNLGGNAAESGPFQCVPNSNACTNYCNATNEVEELAQCGFGRQCVNHQCVVSTDGRECAGCFTNDDCRKGGHTENRCVVNNCPDCGFKGESFCATPCLNDAACAKSFGPGFLCKPVADVTGAMKSYCVPQRGTCKSGLHRLGEDCSVAGAKDCVSGVCLVAGLQSLCSQSCATDAACGDSRFRCCEYTANGYDCTDEKRGTAGPKSGSGVCAPLGGLFGDDCTPGRPPCQTGTCLDLGTARVCTSTCSSASGCPSGFECRQAQLSGQTSTANVCFPVGGGKIGADCAFGPAACESGLCIRKASGPLCTSSCQAATDCPADWGCEITKAVTEQSVQVCVPDALR